MTLKELVDKSYETSKSKGFHDEYNIVLKMMDNESTCMDILTQLKAIRSSIDKAIGILTTSNLIQLIEETNDIKINNLDEAIDLVVKGIN